MGALLRKLAALDLEEKILNTGVLVAVVGLFLPWISGRWLGNEPRTHSGFGFYTAFVGISVFLLLSYVLLVTIIPLTSGSQIVRRQHRDVIRLMCTSAATILTLSAISVLTLVTFEFQRMSVRFGVSITLLGCLTATLYSYLGFLQQKRKQVQELFHHHGEEQVRESARPAAATPPLTPAASTPEPSPAENFPAA